MSEPNGKEKKWSHRMVSLVEDHLDLFDLEWQYERKLASRKLYGHLAGALLFFAAFVLVHAAIVMALQAWDVPAVWSCLGLAGLDVLIGAALVSRCGKRHPDAGRPFEGTRSEIRRSLEWIRNLF